MARARPVARWVPLIGVAAASVAVCLVVAEGILALGLRHAGALRGPLRSALLDPLRRIHLAAEWPMVQLDPACARWDAELGYTLRPPGCTVRDREFTVHYGVNGAGLRDDDASLEAPALIVLGDSFAMGWGVAGPETFPAVIERTTGLRVLNAGVASYGTAREMRLLRRLDRSALRALVVQYCWNDGPENRAWVALGGRLPVVSEAAWTALVADHQHALRYWPGKYLTTLLRTALGAVDAMPPAHASPRPPPAVAEAADDFIGVLRGHAELFGGVPLVVVPFCRHARAVARELRDRAGASPAPLSVVVAGLGPGERYALDGHPNAAGHVVVAARIVEALAAVGVGPAPPKDDASYVTAQTIHVSGGRYGI